MIRFDKETLVAKVNYASIWIRDPRPVTDLRHFAEQEPYRILVWGTIKGFGFIQHWAFRFT
jgi:hypothetical protein